MKLRYGHGKSLRCLWDIQVEVAIWSNTRQQRQVTHPVPESTGQVAHKPDFFLHNHDSQSAFVLCVHFSCNYILFLSMEIYSSVYGMNFCHFPPKDCILEKKDYVLFTFPISNTSTVTQCSSWSNLVILREPRAKIISIVISKIHKPSSTLLKH